MAANLWNVKDVAEYLKLQPSTIYTWAQQGKIPASKLGRTWRFKRSQIDKWIEENSQQ